MPISLAAATLGSGIASGLGSIFQGFSSKSSAKDQMEFQQMMSNTAHRREVRDLKLAGLNPILSAKYGGASTPTGAGYQMPNIGHAMAEGASSAASVSRASQEVKNMKAQENKTEAETILTGFNSAIAMRQAEQIMENITKTRAETQNILKNNAVMDQALAASKIESEIDKTAYGKLMRYLQRLNPLGNSAQQIKSLTR